MSPTSKTPASPEPEMFDLAEVVAEARDAHPPIAVRTADGQVFTFDPPQLWSDKAADPNIGPAETAIEIMGAEQFAKFCKAGGSVGRLNLVIEAWSKRNKVELGKSSAS